MKCPCCGAAELVADCRSITSFVNGVSVTVPHVQADFCPACGEGILNREHGDRYAAGLRLAALGGMAPDMKDVPLIRNERLGCSVL